MEEKVLDLLAGICEDDIVKTQRDINIFEEDLLDSLAFTELLVELEMTMGVVISPSEIEKEDMDTPNKIIELVVSRIQN